MAARVREFEGATREEVLRQIRADLGSNAVILREREEKRGLLGRSVWKIAAGINERRDPAPALPAQAEDSGVRYRPSPERQAAEAAGPGQLALVAQEVKIARLEQQLSDMREALRLVHPPAAAPAAPAPATERASLPTRYPALLEKLLAADLPAALAQGLIEALPSQPAGQWTRDLSLPMVESALSEIIAGRWRVSGPIALPVAGPKLVALVGPTGVGKTTTIAKLAAHYSFTERRRVGLLTLDTYRIAAEEQLRTYADIIGLPLKVARTPADLQGGLDEMSDRELILLDTAGRSQRHELQLGELSAMLAALPLPAETHLVLSATTKPRDLDDILARFSPLSIDRLLFTKLDETSAIGPLFALADRADPPVSYLTTGQRVPDDIELADPRRLADRLLGRE